MSYSGSCHCGAVTFTVEAELPNKAMRCNCSHCRRKGLTLTFVPRASFRLDSGEQQLRSYRFNKHHIDHQFCADCGCQGFSFGATPDGSEIAAVNLGCVPAADLDALTIQHVDGASL